MKFLYHPELRVEMWNYGIEIPVRDSRVSKSWSYLSKHSLFNKPLLLDKPSTNLKKEDFLRVHEDNYIQRLFETNTREEIIKVYELIDESGNYNRYNPNDAKKDLPGILDEIVRVASGTYHAAHSSLTEKFVFYFGGGMHHGHYDHGSGFCAINDILTAIRKLQAEGFIKTAWIIDVDAHKGDGTAAITAQDDSITTLSVHMAEGWPLEPKDNYPNNPAFIPSNIDVPIHSGQEGKYNELLKEALDKLISMGKPDIALVVDGSDPYEKDELPSTQCLNLSLEQLLERDILVHKFLQKNNIPATFLMAGGYGESSWQVYTQFFDWLLNQKEN
ncbi:histone deacetylase family protein [Spirochaeta cellobiosiphila]|uniref:histone deacetylase family protein n=1 Tax=Spirochaeta cellobiosiphila TaxID=504483 RepID=UPI00048C9C95|nr:histone deacetylase [Spirochaeta cellobiosiphila]